MCLAQAEEFTGRVRNTRDNVNDLFGWNQKDPTPPTVNVYNTLPSGDIKPVDSNRSALKTGKK